MKKGLSLLLSLLMVISMFSCLGVVASAVTSDYQLDTWYTVKSDSTGIFIVPESSYYTFESDGEGDPTLELCDIDDEWGILGYWYDENGRDFYGTIYLEANQRVICGFYNDDEDDFGEKYDINFKITKVVDNVASIQLTLADNEIVEEAGGYWSDRWDEYQQKYIQYYQYSYYANSYGNVLTVTYNDGSVVDYESNGSNWYADDGSIIDKSLFKDLTSQAKNPWTLGSNNYVTVSYFGEEASAPVTIVENPVESISFTPKVPYEYFEYVDGHWSERWNDETDEYEDYYYYYTPSVYSTGNIITINYTDGTSVDYVYGYQYDEDYGYNQAGWYSADDGMLDTSTTSVSDTYEQSNSPWVLGGNNYFTVEYLGKKCQVPVSVIENPVASISFTPAEPYKYIENTLGEWDIRWNDETEMYEDYFRYEINIRKPGNKLTVNYTDGSVDFIYTTDSVYIEEEDCWYSGGWVSSSGDTISKYDVQVDFTQYDKPWMLGSDNYFTIEYFGRECQVPVTIFENPVASIEFIPINGSVSVIENTYGYWHDHWDENLEQRVDDYFYYYADYILEKDGNSIKVNYTDNTSDIFTYNSDEDMWGNAYGEGLDSEYLNMTSNQSEENIWSLGDNIATVEYCKKSVDVTVKVIEAVPDVTDGNFVAEVISETECYITEAYESAIVNGTFTIPETIQGYTVTGMDFWEFYWEFYEFSGVSEIKEINLPSGFNSISKNDFYYYDSLEKINVADGNKKYASINGVLYNKAKTRILYCPLCFSGELYVPAEATEVDITTLQALKEGSTLVIDNNNTSFAFENGILYNADYTKIIKAISLPENYVMKDTVKEIGDFAFSGNSTVKTIALNNNVTKLSYGAFYNCTSLEAAPLPQGLVSIERAAFRGSGIKSLTLPSTVTKIEDDAFRDCKNLSEVNLNEGLDSLGKAAFKNSGIMSLVIPDSVTNINYYTFQNCDSLVNVVIGSGITGLWGENFAFCDSLKEVNIREGIKTIYQQTFGDCISLEYVCIPESVEEIYASAFFNCDNLKCFEVAKGNKYYKSINGGLYSYGVDYQGENYCGLVVYPVGISTDVVIPDGVTGVDMGYWDTITSVSLPESVKGVYFIGCTSLTSINIPDAVTTLSYSAFSGCSSLKRIKLPSQLTLIDSGAFAGCTSLEVIEIPVSVTRIFFGAFENCVSLKDVYYTGSEEQWNAIEIGSGNEYLTNATIHFNSFMPEETPELKIINGQWVYAIGNNIVTDYTGLVEYNGEYYYVANGILDWAYSGLTEYYGTWYYVTNGYLDWSATTLVEYCGVWYYVEGGQINWSYNGLAEYYGDYYYVTNGVIDWNYTGLTEYYGVYYNVINGYLDWSYSGLSYYYGDYYYVANGCLDWNYTGLTEYYGTWYYVVNGYLDWSATTLTNYYDTWYYVENGMINWNSNTLINYYGDWYYALNGTIAWFYTGRVYYYGTWYYIINGYLDWSRQ